jgi:regulator of protease activity HflC (stomatin/prohibitin superfamily)
MPTIKVKSTHPATQGAFVVIDKGDFNPDVHELYDDGTDQGMGAIQRAPTVAELQAAHERLLAREREMDAERDRLADQARANEAEAQRLAEERVAADKAAADKVAADKAAAKAAEKAVSESAKK